MKCPNLNTWDIPTCLSEGGIMIPSVSDQTNYCRSDNYVNCPVFRKQPIRRGSWFPFDMVAAEAVAP